MNANANANVPVPRPVDALEATLHHWTSQLFAAARAYRPNVLNPRALTPLQRLIRELAQRVVGNNLRVSVGLVVAAIQMFPIMRILPLGAPRTHGRHQPHHVAQPFRDLLVNLLLPIVLPIFQHPLHGPEATTAFYFELYVFPVIASLNAHGWLNAQGIRRRGFFRIHHAVSIQAVINARVGDLVVNGRCEFVITRNGHPWCVVELKKFMGVNMLDALIQAFVYAAVLAQILPTRSMRAIVTNLRDWRFIRVDHDHWLVSPHFVIRHNANGTPDPADLDRMHRYVMQFLRQA